MLATAPWRSTAGAQSGRTVRVATWTPLSAFDPLGPFTEAFIMRAVYPPLTRVTRKTGNPLDGWEPFAATPSKVSHDGQRNYIDIKAEPELTWSGGRRNTIKDIARGIERAKQRPPLDYKAAFDNIAGLQVQDERTCRAYLNAPDTRLYKEVFARTWTTPLTETGRDALEKRDRSHSEALGPYVFGEPFTPGYVVTLKANPAWKRKPGSIETFTIYRPPSPDAAIAAFRAGDFDLVLLPSGRILASGKQIAEEYGVLAEAQVQALDSVTYVAIELGTKPTTDPRVRQAATGPWPMARARAAHLWS
jgi:ABC-type transport system substrate-binding protein